MIRRALVLGILGLPLIATEPNDATRRWWSYVIALANDGMEGRDTGSEGYRRAARYVATEFERLGLQPAGEQGYFQSVPMQQVQLNTAQSQVVLERKSGEHNLAWLREITMAA